MRLDNVVKTYRPNTTSRSYMNGMDRLKCVHYGDIYKNYTDRKLKSSDILNSISIDFPEHKIIKRNAIIIADVSETIDDWGHVTFIEFDGTPFINGTHTFAIVSDCETTLKYLFYYLRSDTTTKILRRFLTGVTVFQMSIKSLSSFKLELPSIVAQTRIADILSAYDDAIENNNRRIALIEKTARELYHEWFVRFRFPGYENVRFLNALPEGWEVKRLGEYCHVTDGTHDTPKETDNGVPLVTGKCINDGFIDFSRSYLISETDHNKIKRRSGLDSGDILFSNIGTVGSTCIVNYDREFSVKNIIIFKPDSMVKSSYLYYLLTSHSVQDMFSAQTNGASQQFVGLKFMRRFKVLIPCDSTLERFAEIVIPITKEKHLLRTQSQNLARQRDLLLPRLMNGKLDV